MTMESGEKERKRRTQSNSRSYQPISIFTPKGKRERERKERKRWNERKATVMGDRLLTYERIQMCALKEKKGICPETPAVKPETKIHYKYREHTGALLRTRSR